MKKSYPRSNKSASIVSWNKHLRPEGKRLVNKSTRSLGRQEAAKLLDVIDEAGKGGIPRHRASIDKREPKKTPGRCPLCGKRLGRTASGSRYLRHCGECGATLNKDFVCSPAQPNVYGLAG